MFGFKKKLDTLTADLLGKMDQALEMTSPVDRVERLMTLKEETSETLNTMESRENKKAMLTVQTSVIGMFLGGAASLTIIPPAAAPLAMALPILAGILVAIPFMISSTHADRYKNELTTSTLKSAPCSKNPLPLSCNPQNLWRNSNPHSVLPPARQRSTK